MVHNERLKFKINYFLLVVALTYIWIVFDSFYNITSTYNLSNNFWIGDTATAVQSLTSVMMSHLPFVNNVPGGSYFAVHFSPILYTLIPFYAISPNLTSLYVIDAIILYSAPIPLYLLARKKFGNDLNAMLFAITYLFYNVISTNPFETLSLFAGFFIIAYYFYVERKVLLFTIFFLLSLSTMEFATIIGGMFGLFLIVLELNRKNLKGIFSEKKFAILKKYIPGLILILISVSFFLVDFKMTYYFSAGKHSILENLAGTNVSSINSIIRGINSARISKINYISLTNSQYFYLSFLDPIALLQIPWYVAIWISVFPYWTGYYLSYTFPFVVLGALNGISRIGKIAFNRNLIIRILTILLLITMIISWTVSPQFSLPTNVNSSGIGALEVAKTIPNNASVFADINSYPIVSADAWNTTAYGSPRNFTVFNSSDGPPYSLQGYGLYAASGTYVAYERNYTSLPVINDFYFESRPTSYSVQGAPFSYSGSLFLPKGDYKIQANLTQEASPGIETINAGLAVDELFPVTQEAIQEFKVNKTIEVNYIVVNIAPTYGYYGFSAKVTTVLNPFATAIASASFSDNSYNVRYIELKGPFTLYRNTTYYLWLGTTGYPGGESIPVTSGEGLYEMNLTSNVITRINNSMQFSIVGNIPGYVQKSTIVDFTFQNGGENVVRAIPLTSKGYELTVNVTSNGSNSVFSFLTNYAYGSFTITSFVIKSPNAVRPSNPLLGNIRLTLGIVLIPSYLIIAAAFLKFNPIVVKKFRVTVKFQRAVGIFVAFSSLLFFIVFALGYYGVFPSLYNVHIFATFGYVIAISSLIYLASGFIAGKEGKA